MTALSRRAVLAAPLLLAAAAPARCVVPLDWSLAQTLLAIGVAPLAVPDPQAYRDWVVEPALPPGTGDVGGYAQPNLERLASLRPELILTMQLQDAILPQLRAIAPVLRLPLFTEAHAPWRLATEAARAIGAATGRAPQAEALVEAVTARLQAARTMLAGRSLPPILPATFEDATRLRVYGAGSLLGDVLARMGLRAAWDGPIDIWGAALLGPAGLARLGKVVLLLIEPVPPGLDAVLARSPLWQALPCVRAGLVARMAPVAMYGGLPAAERFAALLPPLLSSGGNSPG